MLQFTKFVSGELITDTVLREVVVLQNSAQRSECAYTDMYEKSTKKNYTTKERGMTK